MQLLKSKLITTCLLLGVLMTTGCMVDSKFSVDSVLISPAIETPVDDSKHPITVKMEDNSQAVSITEGNTVNINFTLSRPLSSDLSLNYQLSSARNDHNLDFLSSSGSVVIPAGFAGFTFSIKALTDSFYEGSEDFELTFTPTNSGLGIEAQVVTITITDLNSAPTISMATSSVTVAESALVNTLTLNLSQPSQKPITVTYSFASGTATENGTDYSAANSSVTFAAGQTTQTIPFTIVEDALAEPTESFTATLTSATENASIIAAVTTINITDNDTAPTILISSPTVTEGTGAGTTTASFTVTLSAASALTVTSNYASAVGTAIAADFTAATGSLSFAPGEISKTINVTINRDSLNEVSESFTVTLSGTANVTLAGSTLTGTATINDDDSTPTLSIANTSVTEGTATISMTISLNTASGQAVTVNWATSDGTAVSPADYTSASGTATINAGSTSTTISVTIIDDTASESSESILVTLSTPSNATISSGSATITLQDNDVVWTGAVGDGKWSTPGNWSSGAIPGATAIATFDTSCTTNCNVTLDVAASVAGFNLLNSYAGTITHGSFNINIGNKGFKMAAGNFNGGSGSIVLSGSALTVDGGVFTSTSGTLQIVNPAVGYNTADAFVINASNAFIHNNGLVWFFFNSSNHPTGLLKVASNNPFNNLQLYRTGGSTDDMILSSASSATTPIILGTMTLGSATIKGTWELQGNLTFGADYGSYQGPQDAQLKFTGGNTQTINNTVAVAVPRGLVTVNKTAGSKLILQGNYPLYTGIGLTLQSGNIDIGGYTLTVPGTLSLSATTGIYLNSGFLRVGPSSTDIGAGPYSSGTVFLGAAP